MSERDYYGFNVRPAAGPCVETAWAVPAGNSCTPEERAFLDALKAGKNLEASKRAANLAWARNNLPALAVVREAAGVLRLARERCDAAWCALKLPFSDGSRFCDGLDAIYDYCYDGKDLPEK